MPKRKVNSNEDVNFSANDEAHSSDSDLVSEESLTVATSTRKPKGVTSHKKTKKPDNKKLKTGADETSSEPVDQPTDRDFKIRVNSEGDKFMDLGKKKRAVVRSFKGTTLVDIREYYGTDGEEKPGKKGISLTQDQWEILRDGSGAIDKLFAEQKKK